jgi:DNA-binding response OmpR family regulator
MNDFLDFDSDRPFTVLVADDDEFSRQLFVSALEVEGYRVLTAEDGVKAVEILHREPVDLLLLDVVMPNLDGIEVLKVLHPIAASRRPPIIMVTAVDDSEGIVRALDLGASDYVTKPVNLAVVSARVRAQLRARAATSDIRTAAPLAALTAGTVIEGRYRIEEELGRGAFSIVYRAVHLALGRPVALKVLRSGLGVEEGELNRFRREWALTGRLRHPNAVAISDAGISASGHAFLAMELLEGESLASHLERLGPLPAARCAEILRPVSDLLAYAHALRLVHRDIKPGNIFLHRVAGEEVVKVFDFGLVRLIGDAAESRQITQQGTIIGTLPYMAPELFEGAPPQAASDVYSLGITLYEMLVGELPFEDEGSTLLGIAMRHLREEARLPPDLAQTLPPDLTSLLTTALAKRPEARPTAEEFGRRLEVGPP